MIIGGAVVLSWLAALCTFDVRFRRLPNWLTVPGAVVVLAVAAGTGHGSAAGWGALALSGLYAAVHLVSPEAMGAGDVKLAVGLGGLTGAFGIDVWLLASLAAPVLTAVWALVAVLGRSSRTVPHGPAMCVASAAAVGLALA